MTLAGLILILLAVAAADPAQPPVREVGHIQSRSLREASGLIGSRTHRGVYWTHNDGDDGELYAIRADGTPVAKLRVDAKFRDWEYIAADDHGGHLYLADVGNNSRERKHLTVYRIDEPDPQQAAHHKVKATATWKLAFPERPFNCESLFVRDGFGYVISKLPMGERGSIYRFPLNADTREVMLERVCELPIAEPVTAADISRDGRLLAVLSQRKLGVFQIDGDVKKAAGEPLKTVAIPPVQAEGCCFNDAGVLLIAESGEILQVTLDVAPVTTSPATTPDRRD
jgi:hypothetical protein